MSESTTGKFNLFCDGAINNVLEFCESNNFEHGKLSTLNKNFYLAANFISKERNASKKKFADKKELKEALALVSSESASKREKAYEEYGFPVGCWDVSAVDNFDELFPSNFAENVNDWNTSQVTSAFRAFSGCYLYNKPLDKWDMSNVRDTTLMFEDCESLYQDFSAWDLSSAERTESMFLMTQMTEYDTELFPTGDEETIMSFVSPPLLDYDDYDFDEYYSEHSGEEVAENVDVDDDVDSVEDTDIDSIVDAYMNEDADAGN